MERPDQATSISGNEYGGGINAMLWYVNINAWLYNGHYSKYAEVTFIIPSMDYFTYAITSPAFAS